MKLFVDEGPRYHFRNIVWKGNTVYDTVALNRVFGIQRGDVYNAELLTKRLTYSEDGRDISSLYMDNGYLFFNIDPVEVSAETDSIDLELRIMEGPIAVIDRVVIKGNDRTHEHVIRRELRTRPGDKFSRADIIRSQREIINLGYFNQENFGINTPVNRERGTVDIEYTVEEKPSDQLELSAGWGGFGVVGTLGVAFNNFSMRNIFNKEAWSPLPQGDGQRLSLRGQSNGRFFRSINASFTEPWLGGKKPNSLTVGGAYSRYERGFTTTSDLSDSYFDIINGYATFGSRLKWPDDNFIYNATLDFQNITLKNWTGFSGIGTTNVSNGTFINLNLQQTFVRTTINDPLYPRSGSKFSLTGQFTLPYNRLFNGNADISEKSEQEKFKWLEYHKWRFNAEYYLALSKDKKLVAKADAKIGLLGYYDKRIGQPPFERFVVGGDGLAAQNIGLTGNDLVSLRGYEINQLPASNGGAVAFNKFNLELRYLVVPNPSSTIYMIGFLSGGNSYARLRDYNPFDLRRSAGLGLRVFLPMFGTLGFDYGFGLDRPDLTPGTSKFTDYGNFNIILGFEPD
jgi:outer membrane protein insertion porin family